eukprot:363381_1
MRKLAQDLPACSSACPSLSILKYYHPLTLQQGKSSHPFKLVTTKAKYSFLLLKKCLLYFTQHLETQRAEQHLSGVAANNISVKDKENSSSSRRQYVTTTKLTAVAEQETKEETVFLTREQQQTSNIETNNESIKK